MEVFRHILLLCILNADVVTGEELILLTYEYEIYRYNTKNNQVKIIADKATHMACDFERHFLYYTYLREGYQEFITIFRVDDDGGDRKTISDTAESTTGPISVDLETGNLYYYSGKGIGFYSYTRNYSKKVISTTAFAGDYVFDIGFHGSDSNKRVYWSTGTNLYRSQPGTSQLISLERECIVFSILDNGMVCYQLSGRALHLANLNGVKNKSLPNVTITPAVLNDIRRSGPIYIDDITIVDGSMYILSQSPNQVLKVDLNTGVNRVLINDRSPALQAKMWLYICVLPHVKAVVTDQKVVSFTKSVTILPVSTILMVVGGVVIGFVMIVSLIAAIKTCKKKAPGCVHRIYDNHHVNQPDEPEYSSYNSTNLQDDHVYTTLDSNKSTELNTIDDPVYAEIL